MAKRTVRDLTTGSIPRHILALAGPAILATLVHNLYGLNDVFFAQFVGLAGQTAISNNLFVMITVFGFVQLAAIGSLTLVARRTGSGNEEGADRAARQGIFFALATSLVAAGIGLLTVPLVPRLMGMAPDVAAQARLYLLVFFPGLPALFVFPTVGAIFRARGDARTPLLMQVCAVGTNILGNACVVFLLEGGVAGLAACTVLSRVVGCAIGLALLLRGRVGLSLERRPGPFFDLRLWAKITQVSLPVAVRTAMFGLIYQFITRIASEFGTAVQNGLGVALRVEGMCFFILMGFGMAAGPMVGQNLGAALPARAARAAWQTVAMAMVPSVLFTGVFLLVPRELMGILAADAETAGHGADYLRVISASLVFLNLEVVLAQAFVGAGDTLPPGLIDVPLTAARIPLAYGMAMNMGMGPWGIWWAISLTAIARGALMALWFLRGRWKRVRPDLDR
jgi:putative MATE family efflux protein